MSHSSLIPINQIRQDVVSEAFAEAVGQRTFILISSFPFMFIGTICEVESDFLFLDVETTHISELEGRIMRIHIDDINVFYIENGGPVIPNIC